MSLDPSCWALYLEVYHVFRCAMTVVLIFLTCSRKVDLEGPKDHKELMNVVNDAVMQGGGDTWKVKDFMDNYPDTNLRKQMYTRVKVPEDGFLKIIPITGCLFHSYPIFAGNEYDINYTFPNNNRLMGYEDDVSRKLNQAMEQCRARNGY